MGVISPFDPNASATESTSTETCRHSTQKTSGNKPDNDAPFDHTRRAGLVSEEQISLEEFSHGGTGKDRYRHRQSRAASHTRARLRLEQGIGRQDHVHRYDFAHPARAVADAERSEDARLSSSHSRRARHGLSRRRGASDLSLRSRSDASRGRRRALRRRQRASRLFGMVGKNAGRSAPCRRDES